MNAVYNFIKDNHVIAVVENSYEKRSSTLNLAKYELFEIPELVTKCTHLMKLYLNHNEIKIITDNLENLSHLQILTLDYNHLDEYPKVLNKLTSLKFLNISCNDIRKLPNEIGHLTHLETFWCNNTGLLSIPEEIGNCDSLETFGARGNKILKIPQSFGLLTKLRWLTLESNRIRELPKAFEALDSLVHLNLKNNFIDKLPDCLALLKSLRFVFLNENHITDASIHRSHLENTDFMSVLDLTDNPCATCESFVIMAEDFPHIVLTKEQSASLEVMDGIMDDDDNEPRSDWENSVETSDINSTDEEDDERNIDDISLLIPQMSRFITSFN